ncbi:pyruvate dehydrogenase complex dihydrolipoyllysine-residue acetyltransferase [Cobetia crustatorum]|uniref:Acetyltransferase component of pyruvate dehydrogenase complex n=1 Tax=Cobetia crustatorum TaxID=553385 RepID=A0A558HGA3_9GAMM|nr:pyruvate dehydrogenase complex dihydrolipoyllysine-residue acetyltransferase [Cobetia crustatorum]TVU68150.1 pyruvate dehydrogenase complex dihydrolipoyllysine-residue acetyltransferase [Cobetia crustatorum]
MSSEIIKVPDIGGSSDVEIIEVTVAVGDVISAEDTMITLESDKASMDVPAPKGGKVVKILVKEGDTVSEGDDILELEAEGESDAPAEEASEPAQEAPKADAPKQEASKEEAPQQAAPQKAAAGGTQTVDIVVPDLGDSEAVPIIEMGVSEGDEVDAEDALITLESDKASMDVPSPHKGKIVKLTVKEGDSVASGDVIGQMEIAGEGGDSASSNDAASTESAPAEQASEEQAAEAPAEEEQTSGEPQRKELRVPDISGSDAVPIIEMGVAVGDEVSEEDALITLESDKATMDVPSPYAGKIVELSVKEGDSVSEGDLIGYIEVAGAAPAPKAAKAEAPAAPKAAEAKKPTPTPAETPSPEAQMAAQKPSKGAKSHAGPAVRLLAREFGVDLADVTPSGPKGRVVKEDVQAYVKQVMKKAKSAPAASAAQATGGAGIPQVPDQDFSQFGEIEESKMGRLMKAGATNLHRSWLNVPHVTQFDEADITELEAFRKSMKAEAEAAGAKLTPLPFMIKAAAHALAKYPQFNVSLKSDGETLVHKKYVHIGIAVDTPDGLMVPVIRNADQKSLLDLARESVELAKKAQTKKLKREEMTGGCFTISSLGSIGGTAFTPIVNTPEVAILGVSKAQMKPMWDGAAFQPRLMMPLSLSYDHRAVNGADAARFTAYLAQVLTDVRRMLL